MISRPALARQVIPFTAYRNFSFSLVPGKWDGSKPEDHVTQTTDIHNEQIDAAKSGASDRHSADGSIAATEKDKGTNNRKAKEEYPKAPEPIIGMNDERGKRGV